MYIPKSEIDGKPKEKSRNQENFEVTSNDDQLPTVKSQTNSVAIARITPMEIGNHNSQIIESSGSVEDVLDNYSLRLDSFPEERLKEFAENYRLVLKIESGLKVPDACREIGWEKSLRTAYDLWARFQKYGQKGLVDHRWFRKSERQVLTRQVTNIIRAWFYQRRAAGPRAVWKLTCESCRELGLREPAETTVKSFLNELSVGEKLARKGSSGFKQWQKQHASVIEQKKTTFANELWQGDHTPFPIWTRRKISREWLAVPVYGSALLDDYSRANPGLWVSHKYYDSWSISILYRQAILRKTVPGLNACGLPFHTESDQGADWISEAVQTMLGCLGIQPIIDPAYYPNSKGKVERFFKFLNTSLLKTLPGHHEDVGVSPAAAQKRVHEFLTLEQLREEINKWRVWYHTNIHGGTDRRPIELWEETVVFRYPKSEDDLNVLLLKYDRERKILNRGVKLTIDREKHLYWSPVFDRHTNTHVRIRYNPEDMRSVLVYSADTNELLCEAWDTRAEHPRYSLADVKEARNSEKYRLQSISVRSKEYFENVLGKDRLVEQRKEWEEARQLIPQLPEVTEENDAEEQEMAASLELLRRLNREQD